MPVKTYYNDQEIIDHIEALRTCIDRRHHGLFKKIKGGLECSTIENVKLTLIAHLLIDYQKNGEDNNDKDCLQATASAREGWKIINTFLDYVSRECRDCFAARTLYESGGPGTAGVLPPTTYAITAQSGDTITTQGGDTIITN